MEFGAMLPQRDAERNSALGPTPRAPRKLGTDFNCLAGSAAHMAATRHHMASILVSHPWLCLGGVVLPIPVLVPVQLYLGSTVAHHLTEFGVMLRQRDAELNSALGPTPRAPRKLGTDSEPPRRLGGAHGSHAANVASMLASEPTRTHYPVAIQSPSNMLLYLMMLRITSVLSTPEKQVLCIPERSWLRASAHGSKPYVPEGLVHHMLVRADNDTAQRFGQAWMRTIETAHIFEAKTNAGYVAAREFITTHLKHWCWVTG
ncbi:hypothetical protein C8T65DRAFT_693697 [Cerioporus squamosus]|nr:hypothetical protein C8T65DRAFT_693697 [Cerioporus squamosus]